MPVLWKYLFKQGVVINFLHQTFKWSNDAKGNAAVYCTIVGFALSSKKEKRIFEYSDIKGEPIEVTAKNINGYGIDAPSIFIDRRGSPLSQVPPMSFGNMPLDGGNLLLTPTQKDELIAIEPLAEKYIKPFIGAREFLRNEEKYCLWLKGASPSDLRQMPKVMQRVQAVKDFRLSSSRAQTIERSATPVLFGEIRDLGKQSIVVPRVSSERREYVPMKLYENGEIVGDTCQVIPNATRSCRIPRLFPCRPIRSSHHAPTLAKAHKTLDRAVDRLYQKSPFTTDAERVAMLFERYQEAVGYDDFVQSAPASLAKEYQLPTQRLRRIQGVMIQKM